MRKYHQQLCRIGFSERESAVYLALLQLGSASANDIAKRAQVNRGTTYAVLDALQQKGLVTMSSTDGDRTYFSESPEGVLTLMQIQQQEMEKRAELAAGLVNELKTFDNRRKQKTSICLHDSSERIRHARRTFLAKESDVLELVGYKTFIELHGAKRLDEHREQLARKNHQVRSILIADRSVVLPEASGVDIAVVPPEVLSIDGEMSVCGDTLHLFSYRPQLEIVEIESDTITHVARAALEFAWREAQRLHGVA